MKQTLQEKKVYYFSLSRKKAITEIIPSVDEIIVFDENNKPRKQLIKYALGEPSIYSDLTLKELKDSPITKISFRDGVLEVSSYNFTLLEYLDKCNYNSSNELRDKTKSALFRKNIQGQDAGKFVDTSKSEIDAKYRIHNMSVTEVENIAYALGWNVSNKMTDEIRRDLLVYSNTNFRVINQLLDNFAETEKRALIGKAFEIGKIMIKGDSVCWDNGIGILTPGYGKDIKEELYLFLSSVAGKPVYDSLYTMLNPNDKAAKQNFVPEPVAERPKTTSTLESEYIDLFNKAFQAEVLITGENNRDIYLIDKPKNILVGKSTAEVINNMLADATLVAKIEKKTLKSESIK